MTSISVIIVSWNACEYLRRCLLSIARTGQGEVGQVIVVDNGSTDGSLEMVAAEFPEVELVRCGQNLGFAKANNVGIEKAAGDFLALVNSDVEVHEGCFPILREYLAQHPEVGLTGPLVLGGDGLVQRTCRKLPTLWNTFCRSVALDSILPKFKPFSGREMRDWNQNTLAEVEVLSGCFWLVRRKAVRQVGGLDERFFFYAEDVDWCKRFRDAGWRVVFVPQATITHFGGASSANAPLRYEIEMLRANLAYWRKHRGIIGQWLFYLLAILHHAHRLLLRGLKSLFSKPTSETGYKVDRSSACLRWLLTGRCA